MTDAKRLLAEATPLPWHVRDRGIGFEVHVGDPAQGCESPDPRWCRSINEGHRDTMEEADAELIVYAVNRLPDYLAAVSALEQCIESFAPLDGADVFNVHIAFTDEGRSAIEDGRAALARLRDEVPA